MIKVGQSYTYRGLKRKTENETIPNLLDVEDEAFVIDVADGMVSFRLLSTAVRGLMPVERFERAVGTVECKDQCQLH
jgi:hypothetical protein